MNTDLITTREAATMYGCSLRYIQNLLLAEARPFSAQKMGWVWMIDRKSFEEWLSTRTSRKRGSVLC